MGHRIVFSDWRLVFSVDTFFVLAPVLRCIGWGKRTSIGLPLFTYILNACEYEDEQNNKYRIKQGVY